MRTTIDLPQDLHKQALAIARDTHRTLSETVADLIATRPGRQPPYRVVLRPQNGIAFGERRDRRDLRGRAFIRGRAVTVLLDANVLIALVVAEHVHHDAAADWLMASDTGFATCPMTQGSLVRFLVRSGQSAAAARDVVSAVQCTSRHEFWPDALSFAGVEVAGVVGHRQVTDAYLAQLARSHDGQLATLDSGLAHLHGDVAVLIPTTT